MSEKNYRILLGGLLLFGLYFELPAMLWALTGLLVLEGISNWRLPRVISRVRYGESIALPPCCGHTPDGPSAKINFEAERALCLIVAGIMIVTYGIFHDATWVVPWFVGFALFGAGLSGICPMILLLKRLGFR
jgi:hypothetical protein